MRRVLVVGATGQVARSLVERSAPRTDLSLIALGRPLLDLSHEHTLRIAIDKWRPHLLLNAAAYTAVDRAESEPDAAFALNAEAVRVMGVVAAEQSVPVVHLSTDYVFSGEKSEPYLESDPTGPINVYGASKREGERLLAEANPCHMIIRTSWVHSPYGSNFVRSMLRLAETQGEVGVVADQHGSPTYAPDLAESLLEIVSRITRAAESASTWGVFHLASAGYCTWADVAELVFQRSAALGGPSARVRRIPSSDYPTSARRPQNSILNTSRLQKTMGVSLPDWRSGVERCVSRLLQLEHVNK